MSVTQKTFVDHYTYVNNASGEKVLLVGEVHTKPSKTVQGQVLPLKTILERHSRGQNVEIFHPEYAGEEDPFFGFERLDRCEAEERLREVKGEVRELRIQLQKSRNATFPVQVTDNQSVTAPAQGAKP